MKIPETIREAVILSAVSFFIALVINALSPAGIPLTSDFEVSTLAPDSPFPVINVSEARRLVDAGEVVFVDARAIEEYAEGHIPGARSLPVYQIDDYLLPFLDKVQPNSIVVTYCSSITCDDDLLLAEKLAELGYGDIRIFAGGMEDWQGKGYAVAVE